MNMIQTTVVSIVLTVATIVFLVSMRILVVLRAKLLHLLLLPVRLLRYAIPVSLMPVVMAS